MEFKEVKTEPKFTLELSLTDAIDLWKLVSEAHGRGNPNAYKFVFELREFAAHSNNYVEYL